MKISLNWLKQYVDIKIPDAELIRLIGARLVEVEGVIDETHKYDHIFVVRVAECTRIPNTHLSLCKIEVGSQFFADASLAPATMRLAHSSSLTSSEGSEKKESLAPTIQVVCGAPNVRAGMLAVWIAPGAIVPASVHEDAPFIIGKRRMLKKYDSFGMLAGADELDFGDDHSGIVELDPALAKPGDRLADIFDLNDLILEIENKSLTRRPDCFGIIGFAREVAGILGQKFNFNSLKSSIGKTSFDLKIQDAKLCPRYSALVLEKHGELECKYLTKEMTLLAKSGVRPLDPIVNATNYLMLLTGQPLHAFDYDKFIALGKTPTPQIIVRVAKKGETLTLLDQRQVELDPNDILITSNNVPVALAGVMGGASTAIDENTRRIILESATFNLYHLRKTGMHHGIFSEALTRFTKGQPAYQTLAVAGACADMLKSGFVITASADQYPEPAKSSVVKITTKSINTLLGTKYTPSTIMKTIENVGFKVQNQADELQVLVPDWRTDINIPEDIIEEVGRLNGYDNITPVLPLHTTANPNHFLELKTQVRTILSSFGANELLTYSFVSQNLLDKVGQKSTESYQIINSLSPELEYIRQSLVPSLLAKAYDNLKNHHDSFAIFEMNQVYPRSNGLDSDHVPIASNHLALVIATKVEQPNYYLAKKYLTGLAKRLGLLFNLKPFKPHTTEPYFETKRSAEIYIGDTLVGSLGELGQATVHRLKLPQGTAAFELDLGACLQLRRRPTHDFVVSQFPTVERDLTISTTRSYQAIYDRLVQRFNDQGFIFTIRPTGIYQPDSELKRNLSFHLTFSDPNQTLSAQQIQDFMASLEQIH